MRLEAPDYPSGKHGWMVVLATALVIFSVGLLMFYQPSITGLYIYENQTFTNVSPDSGSAYSTSLVYQFNLTIENNETIDMVWIEHNFTTVLINYTDVTNISNTYHYNYSSLAAGNYTYQWHFNNSAGEFNSSLIYNYSVSRANPGLGLPVLPPVPNISYGETTNVSCLANNQQTNISLYRNNTYINSSTEGIVSDIQILSVGNHNYVCNTTGSQNFTGATASTSVIISPVDPNLIITFNGAVATNATNLSVTVPGTVEICLNVTPYIAGANLSIKEKKTVWVLLINSTSANPVCINRTFVNTTDPLYDAAAVAPAGSSNWNKAYPFGYESENPTITPQEPAAIPPSGGGGGGGGGCSHKCTPLGAINVLTPETRQVCKLVGSCRGWVIETNPVVEIPKPLEGTLVLVLPEKKPEVETEGELELAIRKDYVFIPLAPGKWIPPSQGCRASSLGEEEVWSLISKQQTSNFITAAEGSGNTAKIAWAVRTSKSVNIEFGLLGDKRTLWVHAIDYPANYQAEYILVGASLECDEGIINKMTGFYVSNGEETKSGEITSRYIEAQVSYASEQFNILKSEIKTGAMPKNSVGHYVWAIRDVQGEVLDYGLFGFSDTVKDCNGEISREPLETTATVYLPLLANYKTIEIKDLI